MKKGNSGKRVSSRGFASLVFVGVLGLGAVGAACTKNDAKVELPKEAPPAPPAPPAPAASPAENGAGGTQDAPAAQAAQTSVTAVTPEPQQAGVSRVSGQIQSAKQGEQSFKVAGHIEKTFVQVGERVKRGQTLAQLDDADYALRGRIASVQVEQARIGLDQAKRDIAREEQLKREGATTQSAFERVSNQLQNAQLALSQAQLNQEQIKKQIGDTRLTAAYDGVIAKRMKVEGEWVAVGAPVYQVSATTDLEVTLRVPENLLRKVTPGQKVPLSIPSIGRNTEMEVLRIVPVIQENSRTFEVIGRITRGDAAIVQGQFVEAQF